MIKTDEGTTELCGTVVELLSDASTIMFQMKKLLVEKAKFSEEIANKLLAECVTFAYTYDEIHTAEKSIAEVMMEDAFDELLDKISKL